MADQLAQAPVAAMMAVTSVMRVQQILLGRLNDALEGTRPGSERVRWMTGSWRR